MVVLGGNSTWYSYSVYFRWQVAGGSIMSNQGEQQTDFRDFVELNKAVDNINMKLLTLEKKIDTVAVFYYTVMAYMSGKLTQDEVKRVKNRFSEASSEDISKFLKSINVIQEKDVEISSIVDMLEELDKDRWD